MNNTEFENISFDLPKNQSNVIKVIGVGGGGSNAINHMFQQGIKGVDFVICNTDAQALENSPVPNKIQLGVNLTEGLGAGANPQVGEQAAIESFEDIKVMLDTNTKMVFITAGMGGGTGTGAAPIIAKQAKDMDILTVGIVTIPFQFEGKMRNEQAQLGVENLRRHVDSLIVINNNKLREVYGNLGFKAGFSKADEVLATASRGIAEVITHHYTQNIDLRDAKTVLSNSGTAIMGSAHASGANRAQEAISKALDSPLLNDNKIHGAQNVLLLIVSGSDEITIDEIGEINDFIQEEAGNSANIIMGVGEDDSLDEGISVTIIATGFNVEQQNEIVNTETKKIIHTLEDEQRAEQTLTPKKTASSFSMPAPQPVVPKEEKVVYNLTEEVETDSSETKKPTLSQEEKDFLAAREMEVIYEEVRPAPVKEEDFVIIDAGSEIADMPVVDAEEVKAEQDEKQIMFTFDFPINQNAPEKKADNAKLEERQEQVEPENKVVHKLTEDAWNVEVNKAEEVSPVNSDGSKRYSLEDYMDFESRVNNAKPQQKSKFETEEVEIKTKVVQETAKKKEELEEDIDPFNNPISESLIKRAAERRAKMKEFNYKFKSNVSKIDEIEKQPAYKRAGVELEEKNHAEGRLSRTTLGTGDNDELQFRSNNSFLHDNVD